MAEKIGLGIGIPFVEKAPQGMLPDGYYYQLHTGEPRKATGWIAGPNLHDPPAGDVSTFYQTVAGGSEQAMILLVVKAAGMTFDRVQMSPGYTAFFAHPEFYGSDNFTAWTPILSNNFITPDHAEVMSYESGLTWSTPGPLTFKCVAFVIRDILGDLTQVGCADIRIRNGGVDVGP